jgi:hypothetical protein
VRVKKSVRRWGLILVTLCTVATLVGVVTLVIVYRSLKQVPDYYQQALKVEPELQERAGDELEKRVLQLHNEVHHSGRWEAVFTAEEINGWLAVDLPEKFPDAVPAEVQDPRVAIEQGKLLIACWHDSPQLKAVINLELEIHLMDEPNVIAVRVSQARAGLIPLPLRNYLTLITDAARQADVSLKWTQVDDDPVALITIPRNHEDYLHGEIRIESLSLDDGQLYLSGTTDSEPSAGDASTAVKLDSLPKQPSSL